MANGSNGNGWVNYVIGGFSLGAAFALFYFTFINFAAVAGNARSIVGLETRVAALEDRKESDRRIDRVLPHGDPH